MSMKRVVSAAALAAGLSISAATLNAGSAFSAPLDPPPPCPNCHGGGGGGGGNPGGPGGQPGGQPGGGGGNAPAQGGQTNPPPANQSTQPPATPKHPTAGDPKHPTAGHPNEPSAGHPNEPSAGHPNDPSAGHTKYAALVDAGQSAAEHGNYSTRCTNDGTECANHCAREWADHPTATQPRAVCVAESAGHPASAPAVHSAPRRGHRQRADRRTRRSGCPIQHPGPRGAPAAARARLRLERRPCPRPPAATLGGPAASGWLGRPAASGRLEPAVGRTAARCRGGTRRLRPLQLQHLYRHPGLQLAVRGLGLLVLRCLGASVLIWTDRVSGRCREFGRAR